MTASKFEASRNVALASDKDVNDVHTQKVIVSGVVLSLSDIEIGAIEIKDGTTDDRAHVTPAGLLAVDASGATVPVSAVALPLPTGAATAGNQATEIAAIGNTNTALGLQAKLTDTQPVSVLGVSTAAKQDTAQTSLTSIDGKLTSPLTVTGPLTDTQLRATAVPVSIAATVPVSAVLLPLPTGAATDATLQPLAANDAQAGLQLVNILAQVLLELRVTNALLAEGLTLRTDPADLRANMFLN